MLYTFDFKKCVAIWGTVPLMGFADGTGIEVELDDELYQVVVGADGDVARSRRHGLMASGKITLMQTSPSNDVLMATAILDRATNAGVVPFTVKDLLGTTAFFSAQCWVKKPPAITLGKEIQNREWMIAIAAAEMFVGGNIASIL